MNFKTRSMKINLFLLVIIALISCQNHNESKPSCELIDISVIGYQCDSLRAVEQHGKAAQLYFKTGEKNLSSELFVYSAWQFGEAGKIDSALIAVKQAMKYGMNNPYILDKLGIKNESKNSELRKEVDLLLEKIKLKNSSVNNFEIVTRPISSFWNYFDKAMKDEANAKKYLSEFICEGSYAIKDYYHIRYENVDKMHRIWIDENADYFSYVKNYITSEKLEKVSKEAKQMMVRFSKIYPNAVFPKTYIVPDLINGSGTLTELGLYIGIEMFAKSDNMPLDNLSDWEILTITEFENMKFDLVHELMHFQQSYSDTENKDLLVGKLIEEGVCDFLVSLLTDNNQVSPGVQRNLDYLEKPGNFEFLMNGLKRDIYSGDLSKWMYNGGGITDRPSNLGYTMGYLICKSYYKKSVDKEMAIFELLNTNDFKKIIMESEFKEIL
ncbi:hypothetical protein GCM10023311_04250 [Flaviramulus aquimarinus]|uniref:DUF2268 domain-containing protein n=2 Tax=Flaviramulus aquimarinus TaxID=1170456 RepID=A0ABP9ETH4_9FLAO